MKFREEQAGVPWTVQKIFYLGFFIKKIQMLTEFFLHVVDLHPWNITASLLQDINHSSRNSNSFSSRLPHLF